MDTPFHYIVNSIVGRTSVETSAPSAMIIDETVVSNLYSLGLRHKRILPATGNAPSLLFGSQVSPPIKRQHLESQPLNLSRRLIFSGAEEAISDPPSTGTTGAAGTVQYLPGRRWCR